MRDFCVQIVKGSFREGMLKCVCGNAASPACSYKRCGACCFGRGGTYNCPRHFTPRPADWAPQVVTVDTGSVNGGGGGSGGGGGNSADAHGGASGDGTVQGGDGSGEGAKPAPAAHPLAAVTVALSAPAPAEVPSAWKFTWKSTPAAQLLPAIPVPESTATRQRVLSQPNRQQKRASQVYYGIYCRWCQRKTSGA